MTVATGPTVATGTTEGGLVEHILASDGQRARETLLSYVPDGGPRAELYDLVADYPMRPGKGIRPALCLATCRVHGGQTEDALGAAAAIELLHNAFLVHDDICDGAFLRRGGATLHVRHGVPLALNAGDALAWLAMGPLLDNVATLGRRLALDVLAEFHHLTQRTIEGQAVELGWRDRDFADLDFDTYLRLVLDKTCWYSAIHPCRVGALIGSRGRADLDAISRFGFFLGAVLQVRDDVENVTDHAGTYGKDFGSDIVEGKPTLVLIHLLRTAPPDALDEVVGLLGPDQDGGGVERTERIERVVTLMERFGSIDYACAFADGLAGAALAEFDAALGWLPDSPDKVFLRSLVLHLRDPVIRGR
jgi:geranylgeranyl diphosphate synthase type II